MTLPRIPAEHDDAEQPDFIDQLTYRYLAFISYGQDGEGDVVTAVLQRILNQFAAQSARNPLMAGRVFRDTTDLAVGGPLRSSIFAALEESKYLIVVAGPATAESDYVRDEVEYWLSRNGSLDRLLFVALARPLERNVPAAVWELIAGREEPLMVDLTSVTSDSEAPLRKIARDPVAGRAIREKVAQLAAPVLNKSVKELIDEDLRLYLRRRRRLRALIALLVVATVLSLIAAGLAIVQWRSADNARQDALQQRDIALSLGLAAQAQHLAASQPNLAKQLALTAYRLAPTSEAETALLGSASLPGAISFGASARVIGISADPTEPFLAVALLRDTSGSGAVVIKESEVDLWDLRSHRVTATLKTATSSQSNVAAAFTPSGRYLALMGSDNLVELWDVSDPGKPVRTARFSPDGTLSFVDETGLTVSPDGRTLAVADQAHDNVWLWNISDPARPVQMTPASLPANTPNTGMGVLSFGHDAKTLFGLGADGELLHVWDTSDPAHPKKVAIAATGSRGLYSLAVSPDGRTVAIGVEEGFEVWDTSDPRHPKRGMAAIVRQSPTLGLAFSADGALLAGTGDYGSVARWAVTAPGRVSALDTVPDPGTIGTSTSFSPDGHYLYGGNQDGTVTIWRAPSLSGTANLPVGGVESLAYSPDGRLLAAADDDGATWLWNATDPWHLSLESRLPADENSELAVAFASTGHLLATGSANGVLHLWSVSDPAHPVLLSTLTGQSGRVSAVAFSRDGRTLAAAGWNFTIQLWNVADPRRPVTGIALQATGYLNAAALSPDARVLAGAGGDGLAVWQLTDPHVAGAVWILPETGDGSGSAAFDRNGHMLASGDLNGGVLLWDVSDSKHPRMLARLRQQGMQSVAAVAFTPDGRTLVSADSGIVRVWDISTPTQARSIGSITTGSVYDPVAISPNGSYAAAATSGGGVVLIAVTPQRAATDVCDAVGDPISADDWRQYLPGLPYDPPCPSPGTTS